MSYSGLTSVHLLFHSCCQPQRSSSRRNMRYAVSLGDFLLIFEQLFKSFLYESGCFFNWDEQFRFQDNWNGCIIIVKNYHFQKEVRGSNCLVFDMNNLSSLNFNVFNFMRSSSINETPFLNISYLSQESWWILTYLCFFFILHNESHIRSTFFVCSSLNPLFACLCRCRLFVWTIISVYLRGELILWPHQRRSFRYISNHVTHFDGTIFAYKRFLFISMVFDSVDIGSCRQ